MPSKRIINHKFAPSRTWTLLGLPEDKYKTLISNTGELLYDYAASVPGEGDFWFNRIFKFGLNLNSTPISITQETESPNSAIVRTTIDYSHFSFELLSFAFKEDSKRSDIVIWKIRNKDTLQKHDTALWVEGDLLGKVIALKTPNKKGVTKTISSPDNQAGSQSVYSVNSFYRNIPHVDISIPYKARQTEPVGGADESLEFYSVIHKLAPKAGMGYGPAPRMETEIFTINPTETVQGAFIFPLNYELTESINFDWVEKALKSTHKFWNTYEVIKQDFYISDIDVMSMFNACARNIMQARETWEGKAEFQVGPTCYRGLWVVDGHYILEAARYMGHEEAGRQGIDALLKRVTPEGAITQMLWHIKETGISISTLIRQCELSDDWKRIESLWSIIQNAVTYIKSLRKKSRENGEDSPEYNLMPPTSGDGGLGGKRGEYTSSLWTLIGLKSAIRAAVKLGYSNDEKYFRDEYDDLMAVFLEKVKRDKRLLPDGTPYIPMAMPAYGEHIYIENHDEETSPYYRINPGTGTWALAQAIYPGELFSPDDPIVKDFCHLLDLIDDEEGIPANTGWLPHNAVWNYSASFYAHVWLYTGRPDKAVDYLYDFANHSSKTRVWREEQSLRSADLELFVGDMPHNWASAEFIRLVRHLLVFERGDNLELLPGLPIEWIHHGQTIYIEKTPTRFGGVSLKMIYDKSGTAEIFIEMEENRSEQPNNILLYKPEIFSKVFIDNKEIVSENRSVFPLKICSKQTVTMYQ